MTQWGLDVLFNPSKRHMDEEKQRLQATRPVIGDASGGDRIDFDSGKVRIKSKKATAPTDEAVQATEAVATDELESTDPEREDADSDVDTDVQEHPAAS